MVGLTDSLKRLNMCMPPWQVNGKPRTNIDSEVATTTYKVVVVMEIFVGGFDARFWPSCQNFKHFRWYFVKISFYAFGLWGLRVGHWSLSAVITVSNAPKMLRNNVIHTMWWKCFLLDNWSEIIYLPKASVISMRKKRADHTFQKKIRNIATLYDGKSVICLVRNWGSLYQTCLWHKDRFDLLIFGQKKIENCSICGTRPICFCSWWINTHLVHLDEVLNTGISGTTLITNQPEARVGAWQPLDKQ